MKTQAVWQAVSPESSPNSSQKILSYLIQTFSRYELRHGHKVKVFALSENLSYEFILNGI